MPSINILKNLKKRETQGKPTSLMKTAAKDQHLHVNLMKAYHDLESAKKEYYEQFPRAPRRIPNSTFRHLSPRYEELVTKYLRAEQIYNSSQPYTFRYEQTSDYPYQAWGGYSATYAPKVEY